MKKKPSIHRTLWTNHSVADSMLLQFGETLKEAVFEMRKNKTARNLSMRSEIDVFKIKTAENFAEWFQQSEKDLRACSNAKEIILIVK